jgi:hypothetical protein
MTTFFPKHSTPILFSLLITFLALAQRFPSAGSKLEIVLLPLSLILASLVVLGKGKEAYRQGQITRGVFIRRTMLTIIDCRSPWSWRACLAGIASQ